jgi:hypothetical protein
MLMEIVKEQVTSTTIVDHQHNQRIESLLSMSQALFHMAYQIFNAINDYENIATCTCNITSVLRYKANWLMSTKLGDQKTKNKSKKKKSSSSTVLKSTLPAQHELAIECLEQGLMHCQQSQTFLLKKEGIKLCSRVAWNNLSLEIAHCLLTMGVSLKTYIFSTTVTTDILAYILQYEDKIIDSFTKGTYCTCITFLYQLYYNAYVCNIVRV